MHSEYSFLVEVIRIFTEDSLQKERLLINQICSVVVPSYGVIYISVRVFLSDK